MAPESNLTRRRRFRASAEGRAAEYRRPRALGTHVCPASKAVDVTWSPTLDTPWPRAGRDDAGDTLAHIFALKWERYALFARIALFFARHGYQFSNSTLSGVSLRADPLARRLVGPMIAHAKKLAPYLAIDAAGAKVQAADRCTNGHTWMRFVEDIGVFVSFAATHDALAANNLLDALGAK
jgi:hypothetical protein